METNNPAFDVLVTLGNQAVLAAGSPVTSLANGQIGIFDVHTGLSVDGTVLSSCEDIFIAVGINRTLGGTNPAEDIQRSAAQAIQKRGIKDITVKGYMDEANKVVELTNFTSLCDSDFGIKIEYRNQKVYQMYGYNQFTKPFVYHTACCATVSDCSTCPQVGDPVELAQGIADLINNDPDGLFSAVLFAWKLGFTVNAAATASGNLTVTVGTTIYTVAVASGDSVTVVAGKIAAQINTQTGSPYRANNVAGVLSVYSTTVKPTDTDTLALTAAGGTGVTVNAPVTIAKVNVTDSTTFKATYAGASVGVRITGVTQARPAFNGSIPIKYWTAGSDFIVSTNIGFTACNATLTTISSSIYPAGKGVDVQELEYEALGFRKQGPYRQYESTGLAKGDAEYFSNIATNYNIIDIEYTFRSKSGARLYDGDMKTVIAIPCADTTTLQGFIAITDLIYAGRLDALTDDVSAMGCSNSLTSALTPATDGIAILS